MSATKATKSTARRQAQSAASPKASTRAAFPDKDLKNGILQIVAAQIEEEKLKAEQKGEAVRGIKQRVIERHQQWCPWLNQNVLNYYVRNFKPEQPRQQQQPRPSEPPPPPLESITVTEDVSEFSELSGSWAFLETTCAVILRGTNAKGGTGDEDHDDMAKRIIQALNYATVEFGKLRQEAGYNKPVKRGAYDEILEEAQRRYQLPPDIKLNKETVRGRARKSLNLVAAP